MTETISDTPRRKLVIVDERPNLMRTEYDRLKAALHQAGLHGVQPDLRAVLLGRIAWVESLNPHRGRRLRERLERVSPDG